MDALTGGAMGVIVGFGVLGASANPAAAFLSVGAQENKAVPNDDSRRAENAQAIARATQNPEYRLIQDVI